MRQREYWAKLIEHAGFLYNFIGVRHLNYFYVQDTVHKVLKNNVQFYIYMFNHYGEFDKRIPENIFLDDRFFKHIVNLVIKSYEYIVWSFPVHMFDNIHFLLRFSMAMTHIYAYKNLLDFFGKISDKMHERIALAQYRNNSDIFIKDIEIYTFSVYDMRTSKVSKATLENLDLDFMTFTQEFPQAQSRCGVLQENAYNLVLVLKKIIKDEKEYMSAVYKKGNYLDVAFSIN